MTVTVDISAREAEVLTLLGEHLSNAEIGARLFISVRTVESHVSSLLRKLEVADRRALAQRAAELAGPGRAQPAPVLPTPLTSFVGRAQERAELADLLKNQRQVTALGPGGVGKTRLALTVAAQVAGEYPDGVWFVDLVSVTDPGACVVAGAVASALGLGEQPGRAMDESVVATLADRHALLILDNCEQVRDGVAPFLERLLAGAPRVTVLATSRARLMVPFERVYPVPPLSLAEDGDSDAVALFLDRAGAVGLSPDPAQHERIAQVCARLDGMALAIELAAARLPTLGLDGLTAALADPLRMLAGGSRADERHRSVRAALDWSYSLLDPADRALLARVSVFVAPFTVGAAAQTAGTDFADAADGLARLAEQSLLTVTPAAGGTRYRALETVRQYGTQRLADTGELDAARARHLRWCQDAAAELAVVREDWRVRFDQAADDFRAALAWAVERPEQRANVYDLARRMAELTFTRTYVGESQLRFEQAAAFADDPAAAAELLRRAAAVAGCRMRGDDMYRLHRAAAEVALAVGQPARAAADLATAGNNSYRFWSKFETLPPRDEVLGLITRAGELSGDDPAALAAVALAEAGVLADAYGAAQGPAVNTVAETVERAERAVELARRTGDPLAESAALDALTGSRSWSGDTFGAAATARRRIELLASQPVTPEVTHELLDALGNATEAALGAGDLAAARRWGRQLADHPLLAEVGHRATSWLLVTDAMAGDVGETLALADRFLEAWERNGRPARSVLGPAVAAISMVHSLRGDDAARREWDEIMGQLGAPPEHVYGYGAVYDAIWSLHEGRPEQALERMAPEPADVWKWVCWIWLHWYAALRAEAAVLAGRPDAAARLAAARKAVDGNPVAGAIVERAQALLDGDAGGLLAAAAAFEAAGCRYQWARTLVLAGGEHAGRAAAALSELGLAPMAPRR
ncbi:hypothetical protein CS0771_28730 [Catellatospora sp. IY07-71]|uniref:ATP-binding protein n=1 Tax=Catellatospora sp. IY07-71 TaxID=2728827 RepID=UPI001BB5AF07|nr:LuxR C-terminal-related transcriptional regulator [Catellatospora sp. IY07-71]BCJ73329.1 hypothetical protein CS0771_28730 [Catellatospora sp. IY07-71]